jgi:hypothetical protein
MAATSRDQNRPPPDDVAGDLAEDPAEQESFAGPGDLVEPGEFAEPGDIDDLGALDEEEEDPAS